ncbi:MAG TPA: aspartate/glutamate racemase family protein [Stellaceae bacterium]|nr:aspartate/glutamate racemase family protein [Stellaceae bacterium]
MSANNSARMLGLIGGLGVEAHKAVGRIPRLLIAHADVGRVLALVRDGRSGDLAGYLGDLADRLYAAGASIGAVAAVTPHLYFSEITQACRLPFVNLVDELAHEIRVRRVRRIALFGTRFIIESSLLDGVGVEVVRPVEADVDRIHALYLEIVGAGHSTEAIRAELREIALQLCRRDHVETIVLAGTELALAFNETTAGFPAIDCTRLHIAGIMRRIVEL